MRQFAFQFTGQEALMLERAYQFGVEVGNPEGFIKIELSRSVLFALAIKHIKDLKVKDWDREIDQHDKDTDFSFRYPSSKYRISPEVLDEDYTELRMFAASKMVNLTTAATWVLRNIGGLIFENPEILQEVSGMQKPKKISKNPETDLKTVTIRLNPDQYQWFAVQAVKRDMSMSQFVKSTLIRLYDKNCQKGV